MVNFFISRMAFTCFLQSELFPLTTVNLRQLFFLKGQFTTKSQYIFSLLPVEIFINLDRFGVSCLVLAISSVEVETLL